MGFLRHAAYICWEVLTFGIPLRWPNLPEWLLNLLLGLAVAGLIIGALIELYLLKRRGAKHLEPSDLITAGVAVVFIGALLIGSGGIWAWQAFPRNGIKNPVAVPENSATAQQIVAQKKFYSQRNKNDLADAMTDLSRILNSTGDEIVRKSVEIQKTWDAKVNSIALHQDFDLGGFVSEIDALSNSTAVLHEALNGKNGFKEKYKVYSDEVNAVLSLPEARNQDPFTIFQTAINDARQGIESLRLTEQYGDRRLLDHWARSLKPSLFAFQNGDYHFRVWIDGLRQRITEFQSSLQ